uniref:Uncharacterized protein n=1 Tax=Plectus sambesii TaxID=2011161 RepID=A0A914X3W0_9BILA
MRVIGQRRVDCKISAAEDSGRRRRVDERVGAKNCSEVKNAKRPVGAVWASSVAMASWRALPGERRGTAQQRRPGTLRRQSVDGPARVAVARASGGSSGGSVCPRARTVLLPHTADRLGRARCGFFFLATTSD